MSENDEALAITATGLVKSFRTHRALDGIDLGIPRGQVFGFLGPNGAGKTTTIRILATLTRPDAGTARVLGHDVVAEPEAVRRRIALTGQFASLDEDLTGLENLLILGRLHGLSRAESRRRADDVLSAFDLEAAGGRAVAGYSGGMRRRLDIGASLIVAPDVLFLDEPTTGLDPHSRNQVWELVRRIAARGTTVLLTTQYLEEADQLAERIAVIDGGRVVAEGTPADLKSRTGSTTLQIRLIDSGQRQHAVRVVTEAVRGAQQPCDDPHAVQVTIDPGQGPRDVARMAGRVMAGLAEAGVGLADFALRQPTLDEVFLALTRQGGPQLTGHRQEITA